MLRRLDHAGLLPAGADIARQTIPQEEVTALLTAAQHERARRYLQRLRQELSSPDGPGSLDASLRLNYRRADNQVAPGIGYDSANWTGARGLDDNSRRDASARYAYRLAPWLAAAFTQANRRLNEAQIVAGFNPIGAWIGRREIGYGIGEGGGLVVDAHRFDGVGVFLTRGLRLPLIGLTRFEMHLARIDNVLNLNNTQNQIEPRFWTARGSFEPLRTLRVGINRGMMFGGEGNLPVTFSRVLENIIGIYTDDNESSFANQVISIDVRYRLPGIPVAAYFDWGADDAAGGWWDVPAVLAGAEVVHMDSTFDVAVGVEHVQFSVACCGNSLWYRNGWFRGSWADGNDLLGHSLAGHGREWRVFANGGFIDEKLIAHAAVFERRRRKENLFAPQRAGRSTGARMGADVAVTTRVRVVLDGEAEWADDWDSSRWSASLRYRF